MKYNTEYNRAIFSAIIISFLSQFLNYASQLNGMDAKKATFLFAIVFNYIFGYVLDLSFAKELPSKYITRYDYVSSNIFSHKFIKYLVTLLIDGYISIVLLDRIIIFIEDNKELFPVFFSTHKKERNVIVSILVAIFTFYLYSNTIRFMWAYEDETNPILDLLVISWFVTLLTINSNMSITSTNYINHINEVISVN